MDVRHRCLRGRNQIQFAEFLFIVALGHAVILILELGELPDPFKALRPDHERRRHFRVTMFRNVQVEQKLDQRPFQSRAPVGVENETAAGKFCRPREIHQLE